MKRRHLLVVLAVLAAAAVPALAGAQETVRGPASLPDRWVQGYARAIAGERLIYPWAYPGQARALLTRATDGRMVITWEPEQPLPGDPAEAVTFLWHAGLASGYGAHQFTLSVNGTACVAFRSGRDANDREWTVSGGCGATLRYKTTRVGTFNELFGFMMLTLPRRVAGARPQFSVAGEAAGSRDYYMTFEEPVQNWARAGAEEAVFKSGLRAVRVEVSHVANAGRLAVRSNGVSLYEGQVQPGYTDLLLETAGSDGRLPLAVAVEDREVLNEDLALTPVRAWEIHLLSHSHVDIGYSDPQAVVERKQWKNLRDAVALAAKTASYPPDARFRWNVEGLWSVESYLQQASPAERQAFVDAVNEGAIGLQANYTNVLTGLCGPEELAHWTDAARRLQAAYGLPAIRSAMHTDIPGLSWTVVSALAQAGVRYFSSGPNYMPGLPDRGDRIGGTLEALGDKPFWWLSPSGQDRLLFWMAGRGYSWFHGLNMGRMGAGSRKPLLDYLRELAEAGYRYDMVQVRYTIGGDNGPVDPDLPDAVRRWNDTFQSPRLVIDTTEALFAEFERRYGASLPVRSGDMTPYWEDGAVSTAAEEAMARTSAARLLQAEALWSFSNPAAFPAPEAAEAWRQVTLWHEHTWGAADSISDPDRKDVVDQWVYKRAFALEADRQSRSLLARAQPASGACVDVVNTLSWRRSGLVVLSADASAGRDRVGDARGGAVPSQRLRDGRLAVWVANVPPLGTRRLVLSAGTPATVAAPVRVDRTTLDNGRLRLEVDSATGAIRGLRWKGEPAAEFVRPGDGLNGYLYVPGRDPSAARPNGPAAVVVEEAGPLVASLRVESSAPGARRLVRTVTLVAGVDRVDLKDALDKQPVREKESAHVAFAFNLARPAVRVDEGAAVVTIGRDELAGSCLDFIGIHSAVDVSDARIGVMLASRDAPLVEPGAVTNERPPRPGLPRAWRTEVTSGGSVYAYLLNNYWHTNYKADQSGWLVFRFALQPHGRFDPVQLRRFGAEEAQPLLTQPAGAGTPLPAAPFRLAAGPVLAASVRPAGGAALLVRLYNASGTQAETRIRPARGRGPFRVSLADASGAATGPAPSRLTLAPLAQLLVRIEPAGK